MTPEEIKKIAEEYADSFGCDSDYRNDPCYGGHVDEAEDVLEWLTERFYLVEKGKAAALQAEILCAIMNAHNDDDMQMVAHEVLDVMPRRFAAVFGPDIRKEEEDA